MDREVTPTPIASSTRSPVAGDRPTSASSGSRPPPALRGSRGDAASPGGERRRHEQDEEERDRDHECRDERVVALEAVTEEIAPEAAHRPRRDGPLREQP